jgi:hypothetical protein
MFRRSKYLFIVSSASLAVALGAAGSASGADRPVTGDWDGNNTTTIGVVRPDSASNNLIWLQRNSNSAGSADTSFLYGNKTMDTAVTGDWNGDNATTIGVARPDPESYNWIWYLSNKNSGGSVDLEFAYGNKYEDVPVVGDWDGNNTTTIGIVHPDSGSYNWIWKLSNKNAGGSVDVEFPYGNKNIDTLVTGDWNGDNTTTVGIVRPEAGNWHWFLRNANSEGSPSSDFLYGNSE